MKLLRLKNVLSRLMTCILIKRGLTMARIEDRELLHKYAMWILRKEYLKGLFDCGYIYDADIEDVDKNIVKLENLILRKMSRATKASESN